MYLSGLGDQSFMDILAKAPYCLPGQKMTFSAPCKCHDNDRWTQDNRCVPNPPGGCLMPPNLQQIPFNELDPRNPAPGGARSIVACDPLAYAELSRPEANQYYCRGLTPPLLQFDWWTHPLGTCGAAGYNQARGKWYPQDPNTGVQDVSGPGFDSFEAAVGQSATGAPAVTPSSSSQSVLNAPAVTPQSAASPAPGPVPVPSVDNLPVMDSGSASGLLSGSVSVGGFSLSKETLAIAAGVLVVMLVFGGHS